MAEQQVCPQILAWGRDVNGRFVINVATQVPIAPDQTIAVPILGFILSKEEEDRLRASLGGLSVATELPPRVPAPLRRNGKPIELLH